MKKMKDALMNLLVKYWEWFVQWIAGWAWWAFYPAALISIVLLLASWGLMFPIDWLPVIDEVITLKLAALSGHAFLVRHGFVTLSSQSKEGKLSA